MKCLKLGTAILLGLISNTALAVPAQVILIRHGEKPDIGNELNEKGCQRAFTLPGFFLSNPVVERFGKPAAIFAQAPPKSDSSIRPVQTIAPTADALGIQIRDPVVRDDFKKLAKIMLNDSGLVGRTVLVSWEHSVIPDFAKALGVVQGPNKWPDSVFDQAWVVGFSPDPNHPKKRVIASLQIVPEHVLAGDNPIGGKKWNNPPAPDGQPPVLAPAIRSECVTNDKLNAITKRWIATPLP